MSADSKPTKFCPTVSCSLHDIKIRTNAKACVSCGMPLLRDGILGRLGINFDDVFGL